MATEARPQATDLPYPDAEIASLHAPVLLEACLDLLEPSFDTAEPIMIDATLGLGGHTEGALKRFESLTVIGIDRDPRALELASKRLAPFGDRFVPFYGTYDQIPDASGGRSVDGILMDLGVSSMQLDLNERGFSYSSDAPLDMRMNPEEGISAAELINTADEKELVRILREGSDEKFAPQIARLIVARRADRPFEKTSELVEVVRDAIPAPARRKGGNPAKRTFQAIRVAVNDELAILKRALPRALATLRVGGRIVIESYQSLEDRIVKATFAEGTKTQGSQIPVGVPVDAARAEQGRRLELLTHGARKATEQEIQDNPRAASVRLRAGELIAPWSEQ
ncbi:16S rRNA (cytosine(1402)-N(4))-methyltransferase RsmH [Actinomycetaceae bacterium MB13-C1-2]|nr:16S rRNA (cytosine(1402)-N(4))-methyltransferase RsmH [Actinomycetaceae bacterium MB13-C1-2]